jgi:hypothetical protein
MVLAFPKLKLLPSPKPLVIVEIVHLMMDAATVVQVLAKSSVNRHLVLVRSHQPVKYAQIKKFATVILDLIYKILLILKMI